MDIEFEVGCKVEWEHYDGYGLPSARTTRRSGTVIGYIPPHCKSSCFLKRPVAVGWDGFDFTIPRTNESDDWLYVIAVDGDRWITCLPAKNDRFPLRRLQC